MAATEHHTLCEPERNPGRRLVCVECGQEVDKLHFPAHCGCEGAPFIFPCAHTAYVREEYSYGAD
jgi:hypothetical protein